MGFFSSLASAAVKVVSLPVAAVADVVTLGKLEATKELVEDIQEDVDDALSGR
jgi:hypothetical protein